LDSTGDSLVATSPYPDPESNFDDYADQYEEALQQGLALTGEGQEYYARGRIEWLKACLDARSIVVTSAMDYGCGTGLSLRLLHQVFQAETIVGVDISAGSRRRAAREAAAGTSIHAPDEYVPCGSLDLVYCNGVMHHVDPDQRHGVVAYMRDSLCPGGTLALWENNPWNPGTRLVMRRIPFDRDARLVSARRLRALTSACGFELLSCTYRFIFPGALRRLRVLENWLYSLPIGAQYQLLCRRRL
jgi:SAM-dependent methyltransferase